MTTLEEERPVLERGDDSDEHEEYQRHRDARTEESELEGVLVDQG
ncbi:hypothetical protein [Agromyces mangrovi Wang et al. 2018]|nr:hypothetical protein [Agromyces mangrovi]